MLHRPKSRRPGAVLVEAAIVYPVFLLLLVGTIVLGLGVFRYQQVAALAREGSRWASVHGGMYYQENGKKKTTDADIRDKAILPMASGLDSSQLNYTVTWKDASQMPTYTDLYGNKVTNTVTVTVTYAWNPEAYFGPKTLTSTSVMPMSY
jgi:Flp pilus assembly protein TadG